MKPLSRSVPLISEGSSRRRKRDIPFLLVWALAPLLGRIGPFLFIATILPAIGRRRAGETGLGTFAVLSCLYFAYLGLPALWSYPLAEVKGQLREAAHMAVPVLLAAFLARRLPAPDPALLYRSTVTGVIAVAIAAAIERFLMGAVRAELETSNPLYLSAALLYSVVLIACLLPLCSGRWRIAGFVAILMAVSVIGFLAQSRAYLLVLVALVALKIAALVLRHGLRSLGRALPMLGLGVLLAAAAYLASSTIYYRYSALLAIPDQFELLIDGSDATATDRWVDSSTQMRVAMVVGGVRAIAEAPIFGHGLAERYTAAMPHMPGDLASRGNFHHLHNDILSQAVAGGLVGLALYLALVFFPAFKAWRAGRLGTWQGDIAVMTSLASLGIGVGNTLLFADLPAYLFALNSIGALLLLSDRHEHA
jgi:O-antigen ligase